ncbi:hypothetical protein [Variovorax sp. efr-133-TYG-130]|uniref:hypothetical protein n=1 Tax=Variovorax sp. efr-133-TYG-130 TaxID=3040327 RepID=UPI002553720B|nr:hypothetical protein [Variovorax sp. efr-133-TYG-130]
MTTEKKPFRDFVFANPIKTFATAVLTIGGLFILAFFVRIGFMPDVDLASSTALLSAVALVGLATVTAFVFMAVLPGVATRYALHNSKLLPDNWTLATVAATGVLFPIFVVLVLMREDKVASFVNYAIPISFAVPVAAVVWRVFKLSRARGNSKDLAEAKVDGVAGLETIFLLSFSAYAWIVGIFTALQVALRFFVGSDHPSWLIFLMVAAWVFLLIGLNLATARLSVKQTWLFAPVAAAVTLLALTLLTGNFFEIPTSTIRALGFGEMKNVDLLVKGDVCRSLPMTSSSNLRCSTSSSDSVGILRDVTIRSRIGAQMVVETSGAGATQKDAKQQVTRLVLKKDDVVMWTFRSESTSARK